MTETQKEQDAEADFIQRLRDGVKSIPLKDSIEISSKFVFALVGGCYVVGLLIVNLHLGNYGLSNLNFLQVDYVIAGALWFFFVGFLIGFSFYLVSRTVSVVEKIAEGEKIYSQNVVSKILAVLVFIGIGFTIGFYSIALLSERELSLLSITGVRILGVLILNMFGVFLLSLALSEIVIGHKLILKKARDRIGDYFRAFIYFALLLILLSLYSIYVYPVFSPAFGGGKTRKAEFIAKAESVRIFTTLGLQLQPESQKTGVVEVIFEGSDFFIIAPPPELQGTDKVKSIRLDKSLIEAVLYK